MLFSRCSPLLPRKSLLHSIKVLLSLIVAGCLNIVLKWKGVQCSVGILVALSFESKIRMCCCCSGIVLKNLVISPMFNFVMITTFFCI